MLQVIAKTGNICVDMENSKIQKYGIDKIAFLGLLVMSLIVASFVVRFKTSLMLSAPIELMHTGLSVSIPVGRGWQSTDGWLYNRTYFSMTSSFAPQPKGLNPQVDIKYLLAREKETPARWLEEMQTVVKGQVKQKGQIKRDSITIEWMCLVKPQSVFGVHFVGAAALPNGRFLILQVTDGTGDTEFAREIFERTANSVTFVDNKLLAAGEQIAAEIKNAGLDTLLGDAAASNYFVIKDKKSHPVGFSMDTVLVQPYVKTIKGTGYYYNKGRYVDEESSIFECDPNLGNFSSKEESLGFGSVEGAELKIEADGFVTVTSFGRNIEKESYYAGAAAIPEAFADLVLKKMAMSDCNQLVVDLVRTNGGVLPTYVEKVAGDDANGKKFTVKYLIDAASVQDVFLDENLKIEKVVDHSSQRVYYRSTQEEIINNFPERGEFILQKSEIIKQQQI